MAERTEYTSVRDAWYAFPGTDDDVVISTRARLARNLANFLFPGSCPEEDCERIQSLLFDSFAHMDNPDRFQAITLRELEPLGQRILLERGVLPADLSGNSCGIIIRTDGRIACSINAGDHVRISAFVPGLDPGAAYELCKGIDDSLQKTVQFAASTDFGFLTTSLRDTGTGLKLSLRLHLPSLSYDGQIDRFVRETAARGFSLTAAFGSGAELGTSLGSFYQLAGIRSFPGDETSQIAVVTAEAERIAEAERRCRVEMTMNRPTLIRDVVYRAYASARYSRLTGFREAVGILSAVKWGKNLGLLKGIEDEQILALLYRVQPAHLGFVIRSGNFNYEKDIVSDDRRIDRLRSLILQEAFEKIQLVV
jgi:protein arginine kinase